MTAKKGLAMIMRDNEFCSTIFLNLNLTVVFQEIFIYQWFEPILKMDAFTTFFLIQNRNYIKKFPEQMEEFEPLPF